jgi:hypothetical protein
VVIDAARRRIYAGDEPDPTVTAWRFDIADGSIGPTRPTLHCGSPVCTVFLHQG